ncbi:MAG: serine hydrolase domain-containing protein [Candidatus Dormibacteraceae bacterium]
MAIQGVIVGKAEHRSGQSILVPWWSFTKTVLAGAALALVGQHRLDLDRPIEGKLYSLRHLLQHTSGLPDYGGLREYQAAVTAREEPWPRGELLSRVRSNELLFAPGTSWAYSNVGYLFVRQIIEQTLDMELGDALRELVFDPLGAHSAFIATSVEHLDGMAWGNERSYHPRWVYHGLAVGTASAAAVVLEGLLYSRLLPDHLRAQLLSAVSAGARFHGRPFVRPSYGLGLMIDLQSPLGRMVGHTGQGPGSSAAVYSFPDLTPPRTLAAFAPGDGTDALGALETHIQTLASVKTSN